MSDMVKLDEYDLKLINLLLDNSRLSLSKLAKLLSLSRQTVKARIERLEREGIIQKYTIKLSPTFERKGNLIIVILETENSKKFEEYDEIIEINKIISKKYIIKILVEKIEKLVEIINREEFEVLDIMPVLESVERDRHFRIAVPFKCDYCGKEVVNEPVIYKYHNKVYVFCCKTCFREFKRIEET